MERDEAGAWTKEPTGGRPKDGDGPPECFDIDAYTPLEEWADNLGCLTGALLLLVLGISGDALARPTMRLDVAIPGFLVGGALLAFLLVVRTVDCRYVVDRRAGTIDFQRSFLGWKWRSSFCRVDDVYATAVKASRTSGSSRSGKGSKVYWSYHPVVVLNDARLIELATLHVNDVAGANGEAGSLAKQLGDGVSFFKAESQTYLRVKAVAGGPPVIEYVSGGSIVALFVVVAWLVMVGFVLVQVLRGRSP